jgi:hypothetical protein
VRRAYLLHRGVHGKLARLGKREGG